MMTIGYKMLTVGDMGTNCYLVWCAKTKTGLVIDPGFEPERILAQVKSLALEIKYIVNTHGHADHIGGNEALRSSLGAPLAISKEDAWMLTEPKGNLSVYLGAAVVSPAPDLLLSEGDSLEFGERSLTVLAVPGHTPGGIALYGHGLVFSGDSLFAGSIGRSDFPGGDQDQLVRAIADKLLSLPAATKVLPGHGPESTIAQEQQSNPWLRG